MSERLSNGGAGNEAWENFDADKIASDVENAEYEASERAADDLPSGVSMNGQKFQMPRDGSEGMPVTGGVGPNPDVVGADQTAAREADEAADAGAAEKAA